MYEDNLPIMYVKPKKVVMPLSENAATRKDTTAMHTPKSEVLEIED